MTEEEKESIEQLKSWREYIIKHKETVNKANDIEFYLKTALNLIQKQDTEINKLNNVIDKYRQEREYIKNNLEIDLQRKGVLAQAKGQIAQILEYYKNNDEYFMKENK